MRTFQRKTAWLILFILAVQLCRSSSGPVLLIPSQNGDLNDYLCGTLSSSITNGLTLELNPDEIHTISGHSCLWQNKESITVQSSGDKEATIWCDGSDYTQTGFGFVNVSHFILKNLRFENCGGDLQNTSTFAPLGTSPRRAVDNSQHAVLFFSRCVDITLDSISFTNYRGYAIYALNLIGSNSFYEVTVKDSFSYINETRSSNRSDLMYSGSGAFFHFSDDLPVLETDTGITIVNSTFSNNFNIYPDFLLQSQQETRLQNQRGDFPLHGAGGMTVHLIQQCRKVTVYIEHTDFINNSGSAGGGSKIISRNTIGHSDIFFTFCRFVNNSVYKYSSFFPGSGLEVLFIFSYSELQNLIKGPEVPNADATIRIENSEFRENTGEMGAAMFILTEAQNISTIKIDLRSVRFVNNEATIDGDCILVESENSATYSEIRPHLLLESISVHHTGRKNDLDSTAALSFNNIFVTLNGTAQNPSIISNGKNGGLKLFNTYAFLTGEVHFVNNSATKGGAITMEANTYLLLLEPANILFSNNQAVTGGAVYSDIIRGVQCVMQFVTLDAKNVALNLTDLDDLAFNITFIDNYATEDGDAVYAQPIFKCSWFSESIVQVPTDNVKDVYGILYHFKINQTPVTYQTQMRTHPNRPCFCQQSGTSAIPECNNTDMSIDVPPGKSFVVPIIPTDGMWQPVRSVVEAQILDEFNIVQFNNSKTHLVTDLSGKICYHQMLTLYNAENTTAIIKFSVQGVVGEFIKAYVNLEECPFGFRLNQTAGICDCVALFALNNIKCDIERSVFVKPGNYWIGETNHEPGVPACVVECPNGYCRNVTIVGLRFDDQCIGNRTGEMCGQCEPGKSMQFGTTDCAECSNYWLFTIILYALAGLLLVVALFLFKLTISEGLLATILFYAQLFSINLGLLVSTNETRFTTIFISLLNLELGFPLCFYDGMNQAGKHGLQFVFPIYLWFIVAVITILSRYSDKLAKHDCAKVFVTIIYFSYTKLQRTATDAFIYATIGTNTNSTYVVWFYDGGESYFQGRHLILGLVSLFFLLFILTPYMVFTFLSQWCLHNSWISRHFKPLIDATLAPFKDRWRFWFGLRLFIINFLILISVLVTPWSSEAVTFSHLIIIMLLLVFQAHIKPFKSKLIHYLDLFFLLNYVFFLVGCLFVFDVVRPSKEDQVKYVAAVEVIIIGSAFIVFVVTTICHFTVRVKNFYEHKRRGEMTKEQPEDGAGTEMEDVPPQLNSFTNSNSDDFRPRTVTMTIVNFNRGGENGDCARLRESLLGDY